MATRRSSYERRFRLDPVSKVLDWSPAFAGVGGLTGAMVPFRGIYGYNGDELRIYFHEARSERSEAFDFRGSSVSKSSVKLAVQ